LRTAAATFAWACLVAGPAPHRTAIGWLVIVAVMGHGQGSRCQLAGAAGDGR
jgi:hypothetical protein